MKRYDTACRNSLYIACFLMFFLVLPDNCALAKIDDISILIQDLLTDMDPFDLIRPTGEKDGFQTGSPMPVMPQKNPSQSAPSYEDKRPSRAGAGQEAKSPDDSGGGRIDLSTQFSQEVTRAFSWFYQPSPDLRWPFNDKMAINIQGSGEKAAEYAKNRMALLCRNIISEMQKNNEDIYSQDIFLRYLFRFWPKTGIKAVNVARDGNFADQEAWLAHKKRASQLGHLKGFEPLFVKGSGISENFRDLLLSALDNHIFMVAASLWSPKNPVIPDLDRLKEMIKNRPLFQPIILQPFVSAFEHHGIAKLDPALFSDNSWTKSARSGDFEGKVRIIDPWANAYRPNLLWENMALDGWMNFHLKNLVGSLEGKSFRICKMNQQFFPMTLAGGPIALGPLSVGVLIGGTDLHDSYIKGQVGPAMVIKAVNRDEPNGFSGPVMLFYPRRDNLKNGYFLKNNPFVDPRENTYPERDILLMTKDIVEKSVHGDLKKAVLPALNGLLKSME